MLQHTLKRKIIQAAFGRAIFFLSRQPHSERCHLLGKLYFGYFADIKNRQSRHETPIHPSLIKQTANCIIIADAFDYFFVFCIVLKIGSYFSTFIKFYCWALFDLHQCCKIISNEIKKQKPLNLNVILFKHIVLLYRLLIFVFNAFRLFSL